MTKKGNLSIEKNRKVKINNLSVCFILLLIIFLFHLLNNYAVLCRDEPFFICDQFGYFEEALTVRGMIHQLPFSAKELFGFTLQTHRPFLFSFSAGIFLSAFRDISQNLAVFSNMVFMLILLLSMYTAGKKLHSKALGLLSAFIVSMFPAVFGFSRVMLVEFALLSMVCLSFAALLLSENFTRTKYAFIFGIASGLGMLAKWTFPIFIAGPFVYIIFSAIREKITGNCIEKITGRNIAFAVIIGTLISGIWYIPNLHRLLQQLYPHAFLCDSVGSGWPLYYIPAFIFQQAYLIYFILFLFSVLILLKNRNISFTVQMLAYIAVPVVLLSQFDNKEARFALPILPFAALLIARGILECRNKLFLYSVIAVSLLQFFMLSYLPHSVFNTRECFIKPLNSITKRLGYSDYNIGILSPRKEIWPIAEIYELVVSDISPQSRHTSIFFTYDLAHLKDGIRALAMWDKRDIGTLNPTEAAPQHYILRVPFEDYDYRDEIISADFVVRPKDIKQFQGVFLYEEGVKLLERIFLENIDRFVLIAELDSPVGAVLLYRNLHIEQARQE